MEKGKRYIFIDCLKIIAIILIINSHCEALYPIKALATGGALGNSLFFICSGYCLNGYGNSKCAWILKKIMKLYIPTLIVTLIFYYQDNTFWIKKYIWPTLFWFVGAILLFYVMYMIADKIKIFSHFKLFFVGTVIIYFIYYIVLLDTSYWVIEASGLDSVEGCFKLIYYFFIMMLGGYLRRTDIRKNNTSIYKVTAILSVVLLYTTKYLFMHFSILMHIQFINQICVIFFAVSMLLYFQNSCIFENLKGGKIKGILTKFSQLSLEIYLVQFIAIKWAANFLFPLNILIVCILILGMSIVLHKVSTIIFQYIMKLFSVVLEKPSL